MEIFNIIKYNGTLAHNSILSMTFQSNWTRITSNFTIRSTLNLTNEFDLVLVQSGLPSEPWKDLSSVFWGGDNKLGNSVTENTLAGVDIYYCHFCMTKDCCFMLEVPSKSLQQKVGWYQRQNYQYLGLGR